MTQQSTNSIKYYSRLKMNLGYAIKLCRQQRRLTQAEVAEQAGVSVSYLSLLERGKREDPSLTTLENISSALGVPLSLLFFLGSEEGELKGFSAEVEEKLSRAVLHMMKKPA